MQSRLDSWKPDEVESFTAKGGNQKVGKKPGGKRRCKKTRQPGGWLKHFLQLAPVVRISGCFIVCRRMSIYTVIHSSIYWYRLDNSCGIEE